MGSLGKCLTLVCAALVLTVSSYAQDNGAQQADSLVRLLSAKSMQLIEKEGVSYRKVTGPASFYHNDTYLICDTALWNVSLQQIDAIGNVKILQESTALDSDRLIYLIDENLAQFRGALVQLEDKDGNILRTRHLDYNTRDSVAVFSDGASMKDKSGQVIESINGTYDSKIKTFTFRDNVNMFTDSIFVRTTSVVYHTDTDRAEFGVNTDVWKDDDMLSSDSGWYDRPRETFLFRKNVHAMNPDQEAWSDSLYFYRNEMNVEMLGNVQLTDTTRNVTALAGRLEYLDSLSQVTLTREPAVIAVADSTGQAKDTVYVGGDRLVLRSVMRFRVDSSEVSAALGRKKSMDADVVASYRAKAYAEAREAAEKAKSENADYVAEQQAKQARERQSGSSGKSRNEPPLMPGADSLGVSMPADSSALSSVIDTAGVVKPVPDSTRIGFLSGKGRVRLYREDFQMICDTLRFNELDSLVRLYSNPLVWNDGNRQYAADSIYVSMGESNMDKAYLISNAFVTVEEAPECYDQIRSTEMLAFFDGNGALRRFDAMGGVDAVFYLKEDSTFATVNKSQAKLLSAILADGEIDTVSYFDSPRNNAFPLAQLKSADRVLKGFNWHPDLRPAGPEEIVRYPVRQTERRKYSSRPKAVFRETDRYFPGYMAEVYRQIEERRLRAASPDEGGEDRIAEERIAEAGDLVPERTGSVRDSTGNTVREDSLVSAAVADSAGTDPGLSPEVTQDGQDSSPDIRGEEAAAGQDSAAEDVRKSERRTAREEQWARLDSLDAAKAAAAAEKKAERVRRKKLKTILQRIEQDKRDAERLEKYILRCEKRRKRKNLLSSRDETDTR